MKEVELVIKIPEKVKQTFDNAKDEDLYGNYYDYNSLIGKAIQNGVPLQKGHGRLVDADAINLKNISPVDDFSVYGATAEDIDLTPTIIEADRSEEE